MLNLIYDGLEALPPDIRSTVAWLLCLALAGTGIVAYESLRGRK